jgi:glutathione peroxidase-family protein
MTKKMWPWILFLILFSLINPKLSNAHVKMPLSYFFELLEHSDKGSHVLLKNWDILKFILQKPGTLKKRYNVKIKKTKNITTIYVEF